MKRLLAIAIIALFILPAAGVFAQSDAPEYGAPPAEEKTPSNPILDLVLALIPLIFVGAALYMGHNWYKKHMEEQRQREKEQMAAFQDRLERELGVDIPKGGPAAQGIPQEQRPVRDGASRRQKPVPMPAAEEPFPTARAQAPEPRASQAPENSTNARIAYVVGKIKDAGLFVADEGPHRAMDPSGESVMIRIRHGRAVLIVPRYESEHFLKKAMKRFDFVIMIFHDGEINVMSKFQDFLVKDVNFG